MASISLYRKYRPHTFAEVIGQDHITTTLATAAGEDRLHHAYLFTGPRGTGKTSTARILATSLNCEQAPTDSPCGTCSHCRQITAGSHVDVIEIDAASHGGVDDVRDLRDRVAFAPAQARRKVYIVDECHMLSTAGWNAFLKTVEEPPGHVVFVFATTEPHKVLETILSRTQRFDFRRVPAALLAAHVRDLAEREELRVDPAAVELIVRAGDGSVRDTLSVLDQVIAFTGPDVSAAGVADVLGQIPDELLAELAGQLADGDVAGACALVGRVADAGFDLRQFARDAVEHLRALFLLSVAPDDTLVEGTPERLERLRVQAGRLGRGELLRAVDLLVEAQGQMRRGQTRLPLELALAKAAMPEASGDAAALAARLDRLEREGVPAARPAAARTAPATPAEPAAAAPAEPAPTEPAEPAAAAPAEPAPATSAEPAPTKSGESPAEPAPAAPAEPAPATSAEPTPTEPAEPAPTKSGESPAAPAPPEPARPREPAEPSEPPVPAASTPGQPAGQPVDLAAVQHAWESVLEALKQRTKRWHAFASLGRPVAYDEGRLTLEFRSGYGFHAEQCTTPEGQETIAEALERVVGVRPTLRCVLADGGEAPAAPRTDAPVDDAEASSVAETEAAEAAGDLPDAAGAHDEAIARLQRELGAEVIDDERS